MADLYNKAKDYAYKLLTYRPRSKKEVMDRLRDRNYPEDIIEQVIETLEQYSFVNDEEFARLWIVNRCKMKPMGRWRIKQELFEKGVENFIIENQIKENLSSDKETELAIGLIEKKRKIGRVNRKKMYNFLRRRGFSVDIVKSVLSQYDWEDAETPCD